MIFHNKKEITGIFIGGRVITAVYKGTKLVWKLYKEVVNKFLCCFSNGYWIDDYPWRDEEIWRDNP